MINVEITEIHLTFCNDKIGRMTTSSCVSLLIFMEEV